MRLPRELKMTILCKSCEFQYGIWRPRCPTCGTTTPIALREPVAAKATHRAVRRVTTRECVFCHLRAKKVTCPDCNEPIHQSCLRLHAPLCKQFQRERVSAEQMLAHI